MTKPREIRTYARMEHEPALEAADTLSHLTERLLIHLEDDEREVFKLVFLRGVSQVEVAGRLGYSTATISRMGDRIRALAQTILERKST